MTSTTRDGVRPERAETVDDPASLTVFGVDRGDADLTAALRANVPSEADALVVDRPASAPDRAERARGYLHNPALLARRGAEALRARFDVDDTGREQDLRAVRTVADERGLPVYEVGRDPIARAPERSAAWRIGGWLAAVIALGGVGAVAARPHLGTAIFLATALALLAAYLLAYAGAAVQSDVDRLFERLRATVDETGHRHPVVVVSSARRPGLVDRAKSARIRTRSRDLGAAAGS